MSGRAGAAPAPRPPRPAGRSRDPYGIGPRGGWLAPLLAGLGLALVAVLTWGLFTRSLPFSVGGGHGGGVAGGPVPTVAPSGVVNVPPKSNVPGTLVYVKQGNIWTQSGSTATQITTSGQGSMPSWSPDGRWIYYIETTQEGGYFPGGGSGPTRYLMDVPTLTRVRPDGSGAEKLLSGKYQAGPYTWFYWLREPRVSPDGRTVALLSDAPDPNRNDVVLQLFDLKSGKLRPSGVAFNELAPLGHQDPAWRRDGKVLLYVRNGHDGARGAPVIFRYDPVTKKTVQVSASGYMQPSWSPDGRWIAATRTSNLGTDIAILDAKTGSEVLRLTNDDRSWAPVWSPRGDAIVYLHIEGQIVDLKMIGLNGSGPSWTLTQLPDVTEHSGVDGGSAPSWYIPADQLPAPATPTPAATSSAGSSSAP